MAPLAFPRPAAPPVMSMFDYQRAWIDDQSPLKISNKSRQVGLTLAEMLDIVLRCAAHKTPWYFLSISEDRAQEAIAYAAVHCLALGISAELVDDVLEFEGVRFKALRLDFPNGSKLIGLAANPRTARGASGNLTLDEFAHHCDASKIWRGASPVTTWGYKIRVISTPNGRQGEYYRIWTGDGKAEPEEIEADIRTGRRPIGDGWSRHLTNILDAKAAGHPVDLARAREVAGTDDSWRQEYLCEFLDESYAWLPFQLIDEATTFGRDVGAASVFGNWTNATKPWGPLYGGFDVGRSADQSVLWVNEKRPRSLQIITRAVVPLPGTSFKAQKQLIWDWIPRLRSFAIDATGIGAQLAEETEDQWGSRILSVKFVGDTPAKLAAIGKRNMESGKLGLPDCPVIRRDFQSVRRIFSGNAKAKFVAPHTKDGHADRFWSFCLSLFAAEQFGDVLRATDYQPVGTRKNTEPAVGRDDGPAGSRWGKDVDY